MIHAEGEKITAAAASLNSNRATTMRQKRQTRFRCLI